MKTIEQRLVIPKPEGITGRDPRGAPPPPLQPPSEALDSASGCLLEIIREEVGKVKDDACSAQDVALHSAMFRLTSGRYPSTRDEIIGTFEKLYWRVRIQETVFDAYLYLQDQRLVDLSGFEHPIDIEILDGSRARGVFEALYAFQLVKITESSDYTSTGYETPVLWFAHMLVRSATVDSLDLIMEKIHGRGFFGDFDVSEYRTAWPRGSKIVRYGSCARLEEPSGSVSGWNIPHAVKNAGRNPGATLAYIKDQFYDRVKVYDDAWDAYWETLNRPLAPIDRALDAQTGKRKT